MKKRIYLGGNGQGKKIRIIRLKKTEYELFMRVFVTKQDAAQMNVWNISDDNITLSIPSYFYQKYDFFNQKLTNQQKA